MPSELTRDQVSAIAALANLQLEAAEMDLFVRQLGDVLAAVETLRQLDTTGVPPTASIATGHAADRPDETRPSLDREEALAAAPDPAVDAGFFRVPRVIG